MKEIVKALRVKSFSGQKYVRTVKVAILDVGFNGYKEHVGKELPANTVFHGMPKETVGNFKASDSEHGTIGAILLSQIIKNSGMDIHYELHLFHAFGFPAFQAAVKQVIDNQFDIVVYAAVSEWGSNGDGKGYINAEVDKATKSGIIWINASGNYGHLMRRAPVEGKTETNPETKATEEWVTFKTPAGKGKSKEEDGVSIFCRMDAKNKCPLVRIVLAWNDVKENPKAGTTKDLDLYLYDSKGKLVRKAVAQQKLPTDRTYDGDAKTESGANRDSLLPRELIEQDLDPGEYKLRVQIKSKFDQGDELRLTVLGTGVEMPNSSVGETLLAPADNPNVIVIGASDDVQTSRSKKLGLPKIFLHSLVKFPPPKPPIFESSTATFMAGAVAVLNLAMGTEKSKDAITEKLIAVSEKPIADKVPPAPDAAPAGEASHAENRPMSKTVSSHVPSSTAPSRPLRSRGPVSRMNCFRPATLPYPNAAVDEVLSQGGARIVDGYGWPAIAVSYNFSNRFQIWPRQDERIFITPHGPDLISEAEVIRGRVPADYYEIIQGPVPICR